MKKKISILMLAVIMLSVSIFPGKSFASSDVSDDDIVTRAGPITYKTNVRTYESWGSYSKVSDNVKVSGGQSMSISANKTVSFSRTISGSTSGLSISANNTISSSIGYTLSTSTAGTWYLAYRPKYKVETGIRNYQPGHGGPVRTNSYTVKVPTYGSYALLRY